MSIHIQLKNVFSRHQFLLNVFELFLIVYVGERFVCVLKFMVVHSMVRLMFNSSEDSVFLSFRWSHLVYNNTQSRERSFLRWFVWTSIVLQSINYFHLGGIGKLTDGILGSHENACVVWNKSPIFLRFQFDTSRQFKTIRIYSMNNKYHSIDIQFDHSIPIKHLISPMTTSLSTVFVDVIDLTQYQQIFIAKQIEIRLEFNNEFLFLTEITFENQPALLLNTTYINSNCPKGN